MFTCNKIDNATLKALDFTGYPCNNTDCIEYTKWGFYYHRGKLVTKWYHKYNPARWIIFKENYSVDICIHCKYFKKFNLYKKVWVAINIDLQ